jgi:AcrR family transcriptional regulator
VAVPSTEPGPRSKRAAILRAAVESFGEVGYEHTKWSFVADRVGIGQTALYYYFESKAHCLLTIMHLELQRSSERFAEVTEGLPPGDALRAAIGAAFDVTEHEVLQMRILHSHMDLLASARSSEREEEERARVGRAARARHGRRQLRAERRPDDEPAGARPDRQRLDLVPPRWPDDPARGEPVPGGVGAADGRCRRRAAAGAAGHRAVQPPST